ncbi:MAG: hypothetical protein OHK0023_07680 [Anaerolineae bacterium]
MSAYYHRWLRVGVVLSIVFFLMLHLPVSAEETGCASAASATSDSIPEPIQYARQRPQWDVSSGFGSYGGEFTLADTPRRAVDIQCLPRRPLLGTELYYIERSAEQEQAWLRELQFDVLRIEVMAEEIEGSRNDDGDPRTSFDGWTAADFAQRGWRLGDPEYSVANIMQYIGAQGLVRYPYMMMMHYGGEPWMGNLPNSEDYAEYVLATIYYYNVVQGANIKYWEILNEPDWGYGDDGQIASPEVYAEIFRRVAERVKAHPDPRVNSVRLGGPVLGSGDPIDGDFPTGFANAFSDGERFWRSYIPTLLAHGSRPGAFDIGFLSWHDYGSDTWDAANNIYQLENTYALYNRVRAMQQLAAGYEQASGAALPLIVSEFNLAAGKTLPQTKEYYKNFYAALWHTSALNNYLASGRLTMLFPFFWKGDNYWPKSFIYRDSDSGDELVRNPLWWAYREYIRYLGDRILAAQNGTQDRWLDVIVTTEEDGKALYVIVVNKSDIHREVTLTFDAPSEINGEVFVSKQIMRAGGDGPFGAPFAEPHLAAVYNNQPIQLDGGRQIRYADSIPPRQIVYYRIVKP